MSAADKLVRPEIQAMQAYHVADATGLVKLDVMESPYGLPKAATLFLVRQYAVDYGADGIRANAVNADRIRSGLLTDDFIHERAAARGVSEKDYMGGNLLGREVTAEDVAQAFLHQAMELKTTGDVTTVDGGNIAAALR